MNEHSDDDLPTQLDTLIHEPGDRKDGADNDLIDQDLGPFRIRRKLGEGGDGRELVAEQLSVDRHRTGFLGQFVETLAFGVEFEHEGHASHRVESLQCRDVWWVAIHQTSLHCRDSTRSEERFSRNAETGV